MMDDRLRIIQTAAVSDPESYDADRRALAAVPVAFRKRTAVHPAALLREPFTIDGHQARTILRLRAVPHAYCLISGGAVCVIITTAERAQQWKDAGFLARMQPLPNDHEELI